MITDSQIKAARKLLGWSADNLAERAKAITGMARRAEGSDGRSRAAIETFVKIRLSEYDAAITLLERRFI